MFLLESQLRPRLTVEATGNGHPYNLRFHLRSRSASEVARQVGFQIATMGVYGCAYGCRPRSSVRSSPHLLSSVARHPEDPIAEQHPALPESQPEQAARKRAHAERMLARAERRHRQAGKLVDKWKLRVAELDRAGVAAKQATLWADEHPESEG